MSEMPHRHAITTTTGASLLSIGLGVGVTITQGLVLGEAHFVLNIANGVRTWADTIKCFHHDTEGA